MKRFLIVILVIICSLPIFAGCGGKDENAIVIGYDNKFAPMGFHENNEDVGFDIDLAKAVGEVLNKKIVLKAIDWSTKEFELTSGKIDMIWNGYTITDKRKEQVTFSVPYLMNQQVLVIQQSNRAIYTSTASLKNKKIMAQFGSSAKDALLGCDDLKDIVATKDYSEFPDNLSVLLKLNSGACDVAVMDSVVAAYYISKRYEKDLMIIPVVGSDEYLSIANEEYGIGMRKDDTNLKQSVDSALLQLKDSGKLKQIGDKWGLTSLLLV